MTTSDILSNSGADQLKRFVDRVERLNEDKAAIMADIKDVYDEVKGSGFTPAVLRKVVAERAKDSAKREEEKALFGLYWDAANGLLFRDLPEQRAPAREEPKMTVQFGDNPPIETTTAELNEAAAFLKTPKGKRAAKKILAQSEAA